MEKRTERNKHIYNEVNKKIKEMANKNSNNEFSETQETLKSINPQLFGENKKEEIHKNEHILNKKRNIIATAVICSSLLIAIVVIALILR